MFRISLVAQTVENLPAMQEIWVPYLVWEDPLEKGMATNSSILAWRIPWTEDLGATVHGVAKRWPWLSNFHFHIWIFFFFLPLCSIQEYGHKECLPYSLYIFTHSVLSINLWNRYHYLYDTDDKTEIYRRETLVRLVKIQQDMELVFEFRFACH